MDDFLIRVLSNLLERRIGYKNARLYNIQYLFGASTATHERRKKRWNRALINVYKNKDFIDFLYYQAESDKEKIFQGKLEKRMLQGARLRTLFVVYQARIAYENMIRERRSNATEKAESQEAMGKIKKVYKALVDVKQHVV